MRIGPIRKVATIKRHATDMYDRDSVVLSCGHETSTNGTSARCVECALTDKVWRTRSLPRIRLRVHELDGIIAKGNELWASHLAKGHICDRCKERNMLQRILNGPLAS